MVAPRGSRRCGGHRQWTSEDAGGPTHWRRRTEGGGVREAGGERGRRRVRPWRGTTNSGVWKNTQAWTPRECKVPLDSPCLGVPVPLSTEIRAYVRQALA
ncbi:hypothetical protein NN561_020302 [Cricetulus griseus]